MGYEGHVVLIEEREARAAMAESSMEILAKVHADVGGEVVSAGGTGTYDLNSVATEIQAGSYLLMDTAYAKLDLPFEKALSVLATVISTSPTHAVLNCGLKALGMDHGDPELEGGHTVFFVSDEHITFGPASPVKVGDRIRIFPAHIDPTLAYHERMHLIQGDDVVETFEVDLRGW